MKLPLIHSAVQDAAAERGLAQLRPLVRGAAVLAFLACACFAWALGLQLRPDSNERQLQAAALLAATERFTLHASQLPDALAQRQFTAALNEGAVVLGGAVGLPDEAREPVQAQFSLGLRLQQLAAEADALRAAQNLFSVALPEVRDALELLAEEKVSGGASLTEAMAASHLLSLLERLRHQVLFLHQAADVAGSFETLAAEIVSFEDLLQALQAVGRVGPAGEAVVAVSERYQPLSVALGELLAREQDLELWIDARAEVLALQPTVRAVLQQELRQSEARAISPKWPLAAALVAVLLSLALLTALWARFRMVLREQQQDAAQRMEVATKLEEDQRRQAEEQQRVNEINQQAILRLMNELQEVADGNLMVQATVTEDITGAIADSINYTIEELRTLVARINQTAGQVGQAAAQAEHTSAQLLVAATGQAQDIEETTQEVLRLSDRITEVSDQAAESAGVARESLAAAERGQSAVRNAISGMGEIRDQIQDTAKRIKRLGESSQEIGEIIELISDITDQTNVLALNAAIQAASAGEAGRGFSIVAEEVQRLAERSAEATKQIGALVRTIQTDTLDTVRAMEKSTQGVVEGARLSDAAGKALGNIGDVSRQLATLIESISVKSAEQAAQATDVAERMQRILAITRQTAEGTRGSAQAMRDLSAQTEELKASVTRFKVGTTG